MLTFSFLRAEQIFFSLSRCFVVLLSLSLCPLIVTFLITPNVVGEQRESSKCERRTTEHTHTKKNKKRMQQHQHHYIDRRRPRLIDNGHKTRNDDFYTKLERIRLTAAASSSKFSRI
jgi:hypothetical protein